MKPTKKKAAKRKSNPLVTKLLDLKYRINDTYHTKANDLQLDKSDKIWVMNLIDDIRDNLLTKLCREDMLKCNGLWRKYE